MKRIVPTIGKIYTNRGGGEFLCKNVLENGEAIMIRVSDGWRLRAHGVCQYEDGTIEWDYSV